MIVTRSISTAASIIGSFAVAMQYQFFGYCFFVIGATGWAYVAINRKDNPLLILNSAFLIANVIGLVNTF
jgi:hypothetical protein